LQVRFLPGLFAWSDGDQGAVVSDLLEAVAQDLRNEYDEDAQVNARDESQCAAPTEVALFQESDAVPRHGDAFTLVHDSNHAVLSDVPTRQVYPLALRLHQSAVCRKRATDLRRGWHRMPGIAAAYECENRGAA
jgi:hypothetical protein